MNWKNTWEDHGTLLIGTDWEECSTEKVKAWRLPARLKYFYAGNLHLKSVIIVSTGSCNEEEFLMGGLLWASRYGNGVKTIIYFVATDFSATFLKAISYIGGSFTAKALYYREKLKPCLYNATKVKEYFQSDGLEPRPSWKTWQRQLNPVSWNQLTVVRLFFEQLNNPLVRASIHKNKISFLWGKVEIAELKMKGNKFDFATKVRWTRDKDIVTKYTKQGWVDLSGSINEDFRQAVSRILDRLEEMEREEELDHKDLFVVKLFREKSTQGFFGDYVEYPHLMGEPSENLDLSRLFIFHSSTSTNVVYPIFDKPIARFVQALYAYAFLELCSKPEYCGLQNNTLKHLFLLVQSGYREELQLCLSWLSDPELFSIGWLPANWRKEGIPPLDQLFT